MIDELNNGMILAAKVKSNIYTLLELTTATETVDPEDLSQVIEQLLDAVWCYHTTVIKELTGNPDPIKR